MFFIQFTAERSSKIFKVSELITNHFRWTYKPFRGECIPPWMRSMRKWYSIVIFYFSSINHEMIEYRYRGHFHSRWCRQFHFDFVVYLGENKWSASNESGFHRFVGQSTAAVLSTMLIVVLLVGFTFLFFLSRLKKILPELSTS